MDWKVALSASSLVRCVATALLVCCAGCGSSDDPSQPDDGGTAPIGPRPPGPRPVFPAKMPSLTGYRLVPAFSAAQVAKLAGPITLVWRTTPGAMPFALQYHGVIMQLTGDAPRQVLDFSSAVSTERESGALGLALHPKFDDAADRHPYAYVWYNVNTSPQHQRLSRFTWSESSQTFDPGSETVLVDQAEASPNHNAGRIAFGADGFLYFGNGDDENALNSQRLDHDLFAGIFRIDVDMRGGSVSHPPPRQPDDGNTANYFIPNDNPFVGTPNALEEYWALGLRNPFLFSWDKQTGEMWVGDVGETFREEVDKVVKGGNYEWPDREGDISYTPTPLAAGTRTPPVYTYSHWEMADVTAMLGGFVYRGKKFPELAGKYVYSDWISGRIWAVDTSTTPPTRTTLVDTNPSYELIGISEDPDGELYFSAWTTVVTLDRDDSASQVPKKLSDTMLFPDMTALAAHPALVPYEINSPLWSDGAVKQRWISVPEGQSISMKDGVLQLPPGAYAVKHFELPSSVSPHARGRRLETRVLVVGQDQTYGLAYRWNAAGTDADLVTEPIYEGFEDDANAESRLWHFPSTGQCWICHRKENRVLGFAAPQLSKKLSTGEDQIAALTARGVFDSSVSTEVHYPSPTDASASLEERATSYLAANCAHCHHPRDQFVGYWDARYGIALSDRALVNMPTHNSPMANRLGMPTAPLLAPGNPDGSLLFARIKSSDPDLRMPPLARNKVDDASVELIRQWIAGMSP